jgi:triacylglycerol lipase
MNLSSDFSVTDAVACGELIDQAYDQFNKATAATPGPVAWSIQDGYTSHGGFTAGENGKILPFGFVASKGGNLYVVIRGTQTPLEWLDDGSIQPIPFIPGWGTTTVGFRGLHDQIFATIQGLVSSNHGNTQHLFVTGHSLGAALANLTAAHLIAAGTVAPENITVYTFSGPRVGDLIFAAQFNQKLPRAWRIFNTEDLVPTLPLPTVDLNPERSLGLFETNIELILKVFVKQPHLIFQHVDAPIALTYNLSTLADNHNLTQLYKRLQ